MKNITIKIKPSRNSNKKTAAFFGFYSNWENSSATILIMNIYYWQFSCLLDCQITSIICLKQKIYQSIQRCMVAMEIGKLVMLENKLENVSLKNYFIVKKIKAVQKILSNDICKILKCRKGKSLNIVQFLSHHINIWWVFRNYSASGI